MGHMGFVRGFKGSCRVCEWIQGGNLSAVKGVKGIIWALRGASRGHIGFVRGFKGGNFGVVKGFQEVIWALRGGLGGSYRLREELQGGHMGWIRGLRGAHLGRWSGSLMLREGVRGPK